jgi:hypothetical protein
MDSGDVLCAGIGGFHSQVTLPDGRIIPFAIQGHCDGEDKRSLTELTRLTSHELFEAATDPFPYLAPAFKLDNDLWAVDVFGGEIGDLCQYGYGRSINPLDAPALTPSEIGYEVQPMWSNARARAGHQPCAPTATTMDAYPFFDSLAVLPDSGPLAVYAKDVRQLPYVRVPVGEKVTIDVQLFSDEPTAPWSVEAYESEWPGGTLNLSWDAQAGMNGQTLHLTIERLKPPSYGNSYTAVTIRSSLGDIGPRHSFAVTF